VRADQVEQRVPGFTDLEALGGGGFGLVFRARQETAGRLVAVKLLPPGVVDDHALRRFRHECRLLGRLSGHPNVVTVLDSGRTSSGWPYIAMDLCEGGSLHDRLTRQGRLQVEDVLRVGVRIAGALAAAHAAGILHRDVKPGNILVSRYGEPALADFGIASLRETAEATAPPDGLAPLHVAPEIIEGGPPTVAADVYSLGSTLYHLLAGRSAFERDDGAAGPLLLRILSERPAPVRDVPAPAMAAIERAMARGPEDRFPDALAFAAGLRMAQAELGLALTDLPTQTWEVPMTAAAPDPAPAPGTTTVPPPAERPARRRRWPLVALGAAVALAAGAGGFAAWPRPAPARHGPAPAPAAAPAAVSADALASSRPTGLVATGGGTSVMLRWRLPAGSSYPLFVQQVAASQATAPLRPLDAGTTATTVTGLDAGAGYCFEVGALVALGQPSAVAWSQPVCIRGAVAG
jgi:serine/threonine-protein kinase PknK